MNVTPQVAVTIFLLAIACIIFGLSLVVYKARPKTREQRVHEMEGRWEAWSQVTGKPIPRSGGQVLMCAPEVADYTLPACGGCCNCDACGYGNYLP